MEFLKTTFLGRSSSTLLLRCSLLDQAGTTRISNNIKNAFLNEFLSDVEATQENMLESMMEQMLESQQNAMVESYKKLGTVYSESSEKFEAPNTHDKKPDIQVQQTDKVTKRQKQKPRQIVDPFMSEGDEHH